MLPNDQSAGGIAGHGYDGVFSEAKGDFQVFNRSMKSVFGSRDGFTMIEVVVASTVMMIVCMAVLGTFAYARRTASLTENRLASLHIARQVMESLCVLAYTDSALTASTTKKQLPGFPSTRGYYTVTADSDNKTKDITVVVQWAEPTGMTQVQSVSLTTSLSLSVHR